MSLVPTKGLDTGLGTGLVPRSTGRTHDDSERQTITLIEMEKMRHELHTLQMILDNTDAIRMLEYLFQFFHALFRYSFAHNMYGAFYLIAVDWLDTWYVTLFLWVAFELLYNDYVLYYMSFHPSGRCNMLGSHLEHFFLQIVMLVIVFAAILLFEEILVFLGPLFETVAKTCEAVRSFLTTGYLVLNSVVSFLKNWGPLLGVSSGTLAFTYKVFSFFTDTASKSSGLSDGWFPRVSDDWRAYGESWTWLFEIMRGCQWAVNVYTWCHAGPYMKALKLITDIGMWWNR
jgi:hypothetical protein